MRFKIGRVKIKISFSFFAVLTLLLAAEGGGAALVSLSCAMLHEMGHILALLCFKSAPDEIYFGIFGVRIRQNKYALPCLKQAVTVLCGPLVNAVLFAFSLMAGFNCRGELFFTFSAVNLVMGTFNMLPVLPLDGGLLLMIILSRFFEREVAQKIMRVVCAVMLTALISAGVLLAVATGFNISLLVTGVYLCLTCIKSIRFRY